MSVALAPVLLFTYKRLGVLKQTVLALQENMLALQTELFVFSDGAKNPADQADIDEIRSFVRGIEGFKSVSVSLSPVNKGLANSIIDGVSQVLQTYDRVIVLEDDILTSKNFLCFMNGALDFYKTEVNVFSISAYTFPFKKPASYAFDSYAVTRGGSWGWASWKDRWEKVDWTVTDYADFKVNKAKQKKLSVSGSDLVDMLHRQMNGKMDSWAIRWWYHQSKEQKLTVYPVVSKVLNNGFDKDATHTTNFNRYTTIVDSSSVCDFNFAPARSRNPYFQKAVQQKFSIPTRIIFGTVMSFWKKLFGK